MIQTLIVAVVVVACSLRAAWILAPATVRRSVARVLLAWPLPRVLATPLRKHAQATSAGCACDGCDGAPATAKPQAAGGAAPITFHRRVPR